MDIKWSYYLIAIIYVLVLVLRLMNIISARRFKNQYKDCKSVFSIKKDFFTTVSTACIATTIAINGAAMIGRRPINKDSILITILVIGFTIINSCYTVLFAEEEGCVCYLGYQLKQGDIEELKIKEGRLKTTVSMTLTKEIDSYNYTKLMIFGNNKKNLEGILTRLKSEKVAE